MTKREKELQSVRNRIKRLEKLRDQAIRDLVMTETKLPALRKQHKKLTDRVLAAELKKATPISERLAEIGRSVSEEDWKMLEKTEAAMPAAAPALPVDDDGIPAVLRRNRQLQSLPDPKSKEKKAEYKAVRGLPSEGCLPPVERFGMASRSHRHRLDCVVRCT